MKPLARSIVVWIVCAAILAAQWPAAAWAATAAAPEATVAEAAAMFLRFGVYKDDADPLKTYLISEGQLTPIGRVMIRSLRTRYNPAEEVESMKPMLDRLRGMGPYNQARQEGSARALRIWEQRFGTLSAASAGSGLDVQPANACSSLGTI